MRRKILFKILFWSVHTNEKFVILEQKKGEYHQFKLYIPYKDIDSLLREFHISAFLSMERALLKYSAFQLHASVISWNGKVFFFRLLLELENLHRQRCGKNMKVLRL